MRDQSKEICWERWYVRIDGWHPTPLNQLLNCHWAKRGRLKKHDAAIIKASLLGADVPAAEQKRRVSLDIVLGPGQRGADSDAYWKTVLDALVHSGALVDDSKEWCELGEVAYLRSERPGTVIVLENCPAPKPVITADTLRAGRRTNRTLGLRLKTL